MSPARATERTIRTRRKTRLYPSIGEDFPRAEICMCARSMRVHDYFHPAPPRYEEQRGVGDRPRRAVLMKIGVGTRDSRYSTREKTLVARVRIPPDTRKRRRRCRGSERPEHRRSITISLGWWSAPSNGRKVDLRFSRPRPRERNASTIVTRRRRRGNKIMRISRRCGVKLRS